jgi:predicted nucleotide-binding protein
MPNVTLVVRASDLERRLDQQAEVGEKLLELPYSTDEDAGELKRWYFEWDDYNIAMLNGAFESSGWMTVTPAGDYDGAGIRIVDLILTRAAPGIPPERIGTVRDVIRAKIGVLRSIGQRLDVYPVKHTQEPAADKTGDAIFIVHGHALLKREEVRRFLERATSRQIVVLEDEANQGRDVLGKLLDSAKQAAYAVVLLTADDEGRQAGSSGEWNPRARQNVVLELGLFLGLLGRDKVAALHEPTVEIPSDFSGVVYIKLDDGGWKMKLATELKNAGIEVDLNKSI